MRIDQKAKRKSAIVSVAVTLFVIVIFVAGVGYAALWFANSAGTCTAQYLRPTGETVTETDCS